MSVENKDLKEGSLEVVGQEHLAGIPPKSTRPPIVYTSLGAFAKSFVARWKSIWTRQFILALLSGQVVSLCITCTNVTTTELVTRGWTLSTTQGFFLCVFSSIMILSETPADSFLAGTSHCSLYTRLTLYINVRVRFTFCITIPFQQPLVFSIDGFKGWGNVIIRDGWKCKFQQVPIFLMDNNY
jgi:hypothetical protein